MQPEPTGFWRWSLGIVALGLAAFHLYAAGHGVFSPMVQRSIHLFGLLILTFGLVRVRKNATSPSPRPVDWPFLALSAGLGVFFLANLGVDQVLERGIAGPSQVEIWAGALLILLVLEASRRAVGPAIVLVALGFILYGYLGPYLPAFLAHKGYDTERLVSYLVWSTEGLFGIPLAVSATFVVVFILFGALLNRLGAGDLFVNLALALTGKRAAGPAQAAVLGSALMGSVSGSSVSNVVTTGTFTIPLMVRTGYTPLFAGAVEACASTGGQLMPPVMGAAAFVMAELLGLSYARVALAAALPALLYFLSLALSVYFQAKRQGLKAAGGEGLPGLASSLKKSAYLLIPLGVLVHLLLVEQLSPMRSGFFAICALALTEAVVRLVKGSPIPWREMCLGLEAGIRVAAPVALACASAGLVIGVVSLTGLGVRFTQMVLQLSGGVLWLAALLTMLACLILGMGLPTTAAYVITAVLGAPALTSLGVPALAAHLFIFYFAIISFITPPVAISAFAASGVSGAGAMRTGVVAFRLGLAGFLVPFLFIYAPSLVLEGDLSQTALHLGSAVLGVSALSGALEGWFVRPLNWWLRLIFGAGALALISPTVWGLAGALPILAALLWRAVRPWGLVKSAG